MPEKSQKKNGKFKLILFSWVMIPFVTAILPNCSIKSQPCLLQEFLTFLVSWVYISVHYFITKPQEFQFCAPHFIFTLCLPGLTGIQCDPRNPAFTCLVLITTSVSTLFFGNSWMFSQYFPFNYGVWTLGICHFGVVVKKSIVARKKE